jgi:hypothetical protein
MSKRKGEDSNAPQWAKVVRDLVELRNTLLKEWVTQERQD